jgi:hypothetical protein
MTGKKISLSCERIVADRPNPNNRIYTRKVLEQMVKQVQGRIKIGSFIGRLGTSAERVRMRDASHRVTKLQVSADGKLHADLEVLETPKGMELLDMLDVMGADKLEIIPYGVGSVSGNVIGEDYRLASLDVVPRLEEDIE